MDLKILTTMLSAMIGFALIDAFTGREPRAICLILAAIAMRLFAKEYV